MLPSTFGLLSMCEIFLSKYKLKSVILIETIFLTDLAQIYDLVFWYVENEYERKKNRF